MAYDGYRNRASTSILCSTFTLGTVYHFEQLTIGSQILLLPIQLLIKKKNDLKFQKNVYYH